MGIKRTGAVLGNVKTSNIILYCREWKETVRFYRDRLQLPVIFSTDWFVEFRLNAKSSLSVADRIRSSIESCEGKGMTLALEVEEISSVHQCVERAGLGPTPVRKHSWGARVFYLFDPEGHRIEIWQPDRKR